MKIGRERRHRRIRAKIQGTAKRPRLCVFRSNRYIYAQLIDDEKNKVLASAKDSELKSKKVEGKIAVAFRVGELIAQKAIEKKNDKVVFDRGGHKYHGRVKSLAEGARKGGLIF